jgi:hypothetical protein
MSIQARDSIDGQLGPVNASSGKLETANFLWDTDTLSWIRETAGTASGPSANVSVQSTVGLTDTQLRASPLQVQTSEPEYTSRIEDLETIIYIGKAVTGSSEASSIWSIKRISFSGANTITLWAGGSSSFTNAWSNRASLSYS